MDVKFLADTKMADSKRELELQKAAFNQEVNTKVILIYTWLSHSFDFKARESWRCSTYSHSHSHTQNAHCRNESTNSVRNSTD